MKERLQKTAKPEPRVYVKPEVRVLGEVRGLTQGPAKDFSATMGAAPEPVPSPREVSSERSPKKTLAGGTRARPAGSGGKRRAADELDASDVAQRRVTASPYDRAHRYRETDWFVHPRFGVGQVRRVTPDGAIEVLFEDGSTKKMLHAAPG